MNCPDCDSLLYKSECQCGFKIPAITTIEIKKIGADISEEPLPKDEKVEEVLRDVKLSGKEYGEYCMKYLKKILREKSC